MNQPLPDDVIARVRWEFGDRSEVVLSLILAQRRIGSDDYFDDRLVRCAVVAARGDVDRLSLLIKLGVSDYRDLIVDGEYDEHERRCRNLTASFLVEGDENFWIAELAEVLQARGYFLTNLESHPAMADVDFPANSGEGRATFAGPKGTIQVEKKDMRWKVCGDRQALEVHGMNREFADEKAFRDAVSGMLLSRIP